MAAGALAELRDIHPPADPAWWPPAPGWWLLALALLALALLVARHIPAWRRRRRLRRAALTELAVLRRRLAGGTPAADVVADLSALLRRVALTRDPRASVAGLTGRAWLAYLDRCAEPGGHARRSHPAGGFTAGIGRCLVSAPYGGPAPDDARPLLDLSERWIRRNAGAREVA